MADGSNIEWTDATWNWLAGCSLASPGCEACYAMRFSHRFSGPGGRYEGLTVLKNAGVRWTGEVRALSDKAFNQPFRWREPRRVFVNSMSDTFHPDAPKEAVFRAFDIMSHCERHTFQVLTKRPDRAAELLAELDAMQAAPSRWPLAHRLPLPWVWIGASVEDRKRLARLDDLRRVPAAVRFVSFEPLLEDLGEVDLSGIAWAIVGGESGAGAREMRKSWAESLVEQCRRQNVACFVKQMGAVYARRAGMSDGKGGALDEMPPGLRVREFPAARDAGQGDLPIGGGR